MQSGRSGVKIWCNSLKEEVKLVTEPIANPQYVRMDQAQLLPRPTHQDSVEHAHAKPDKAPQASEVGSQASTVNAKEPLTKEELAEMLRRLNLTLDVFEIAAKFSVSEEDHRIRVMLVNTRTGEVIRRIPPYEFKANYHALVDGMGMLINRLF